MKKIAIFTLLTLALTCFCVIQLHAARGATPTTTIENVTCSGGQSAILVDDKGITDNKVTPPRNAVDLKSTAVAMLDKSISEDLNITAEDTGSLSIEQHKDTTTGQRIINYIVEHWWIILLILYEICVRLIPTSSPWWSLINLIGTLIPNNVRNRRKNR